MRIIRSEPSPEVAEYLAAKADADRAQQRLRKIQSVLVAEMAAARQKSIKWTDENGLVESLTFVQRRTTIVDEARLRKALTAKVYDKYTVKKLDKARMEKAMNAGELDPVTVAKFVSSTLSEPYLKYTIIEPKAEQ